MKKKSVLLLILMLISSIIPIVSSNNSFPGIFLIENAEDWITAGFVPVGLPVYNNEGLTEFWMPIAFKKEDVSNLQDKDVDHTIYHGNQAFNNRFRSIDFEIIESDIYYVVIYHMMVYASNESFSIDFVPKIKGEELPQFAWWNSSWSYFKVGDICDEFDDYSMELLVGNSSGGDVNCTGNANSNFSDIRFVTLDNTSVYPYWRQNYTADVQATFWVNNSDNASGILMYYGNSIAPYIGNASDVFIDFDDCNSLTPWDIDFGNPVVVGSTIVIDSGGAGIEAISQSVVGLGTHFAYHIRMKYDTAGTDGRWGIGRSDQSPNQGTYSGPYLGFNAGTLRAYYSAGWHNLFAYGDNVYFILKLLVNDTTNTFIAIKDDGTPVTGNSFRNAITIDDQGGYEDNNVDELVLDWSFFRLYHLPEPSWCSWGTQQVFAPSVNYSSNITVLISNITICPCCVNLGITVLDNDSSAMNITWYTNYSGSWIEIAELLDVPNGTYYLSTYKLNEVFYNSTYWFNVSVGDGVTIAWSSGHYLNMDKYNNCSGDNMEVTIGSAQLGIFLTLVLFFFFFSLGYKERHNSGGLLMLFSGFIFVGLEFMISSYLNAIYIVPLLTPFAIVFIIMGVMKWLYFDVEEDKIVYKGKKNKRSNAQNEI